MRVALGVAVFSGMLGVTLFGIFFTPVFYVVIRWFSGGKEGKAAHHGKQLDEPGAVKINGPLSEEPGVMTVGPDGTK
jgi:hypothetical protein